MMRTRLLWFTSGFLITGTSIGCFLHRELSSDRHLLLAQLKHNFEALETRVFNLESLPRSSNAQDRARSNSV